MQFPSCPKPPDDLVARMEGFASPFYTVDFGELENGAWTVLETGDGQVSGLASELEPDAFYAALTERLATETDPQHFPVHPHSVGYAAKNERYRNLLTLPERLSAADGQSLCADRLFTPTMRDMGGRPPHALCGRSQL